MSPFEAFRLALLAYDASLYTGTYADQRRLLKASIAANVAWVRSKAGVDVSQLGRAS